MVSDFYTYSMNAVIILAIIYCLYKLSGYILYTIKQYKNTNIDDMFLQSLSFNRGVQVIVLDKQFGFVKISNIYNTGRHKTLTNPRYEFFPLFLLDSIRIN